MSHIPSIYNPIKTIDLGPNIYVSKTIPTKIDLNEVGNEKPFPLHFQIDMQTANGLPFILSLKQRTDSSETLKTDRVFYFSINTKYEDTFQYLGRSDERNKGKSAFLNAFLEANKGCMEAQSQLADMYAEGRGVTQDADEAMRYYRLAAMQGDLKSRTLVAICMTHGLFEGVDPGNGFALLQLITGISQYPEAHYQLAKLLEEGRCCEKDLEKAVHHCEIAAGQGHKMALLALAVHYTEQKDYEKVCDLIKKMIALNFGKDKGEGEALRWIDQLGVKHPATILEAAESLREKILTFQ